MSVTYCEDCFPEGYWLERFTTPPILPCEACGRHDNRQWKAHPLVRTHSYGDEAREIYRKKEGKT